MSQDMASLDTESQTFTTKLWMIYKHNLITVDFDKKNCTLRLIGAHNIVLVPLLASLAPMSLCILLIFHFLGLRSR